MKKWMLIFLLNVNLAAIAQGKFVNQNDSYFYQNSIIKKNEQNSLCGPVSFVNWLIYKNIIDQSSGLNLLKSLQDKSKSGINIGHTEQDLIQLMTSTLEDYGIHNNYQIRSYQTNKNFKEIENLQINRAQILLLKISPISNRKPINSMGIENDFNELNTSYYHYVFKSGFSNNKLILIDPLAPNKIISTEIELINQYGVERIFLDSKINQYFKNVPILGTFQVQIISSIEELN